MEAIATRFLKKWAGFTRSANTSILYLPQKSGSLNLPSMSTLHKCLQVSRQAQLLTSADACVRHLAERDLKYDLSLSRCKFRGSVAVHDVMVMDPDFSRKSLTTRVKGYVQTTEDDDRLTSLQTLSQEADFHSTGSRDLGQSGGKPT